MYEENGNCFLGCLFLFISSGSLIMPVFYRLERILAMEVKIGTEASIRLILAAYCGIILQISFPREGAETGFLWKAEKRN